MLSPRCPWDGRRGVLGVTGGIAAYKSVQVARDLTRLGAQVDVILTSAAERFVGGLSCEGGTGRPALTQLFSVEGAALHLRLGREAAAIVVAPHLSFAGTSCTSSSRAMTSMFLFRSTATHVIMCFRIGRSPISASVRKAE